MWLVMVRFGKLIYYISLVIWLFTLFIILILMRYSIVGVVSDSMSPVINKGEYVIAKNCRVSECKEGDIVIYRSVAGINIIHRVVGVYWDDTEEGVIEYLVVRGDANANEDYERVTDSNIMKKVVYIPGNGLLSSVLDTVINSKVRFIYYIIYAIILIPTPLLIGDFIRKEGIWYRHDKSECGCEEGADGADGGENGYDEKDNKIDYGGYGNSRHYKIIEPVKLKYNNDGNYWEVDNVRKADNNVEGVETDRNKI